MKEVTDMNKSNKTALEISDLSVRYHEDWVLKDLHLTLPQGSRVAIVGPNGAGKSTLFKASLGLIPRQSGQIRFLNQPLEHVQRQIAYLPQQAMIDWDFPITVKEVVMMGRYPYLGWIKRPNSQDEAICQQALETIGLSDYQDRQISQLSGGQRQRVFIARAIAQESQLYLMDEPLAGVDKKTEGLIIDFLSDLQAKGITSVVIHHDLNTLKAYFDYLVLINQRVIAAGPIDQVLTLDNLTKCQLVPDGGGKSDVFELLFLLNCSFCYLSFSQCWRGGRNFQCFEGSGFDWGCDRSRNLSWCHSFFHDF